MTTKHNLDFEVAEWQLNPTFKRFRIGTCEGLWSSNFFSYIILAIDNSEQGNGHLEDVFQWFENSCKRDKKSLIVAEILNDRFAKHLTTKRGFKKIKGTENYIKETFK